MKTLTAVIRCKPGSQDRVRSALLAVGRFVQENEPDTRAYFITEGADAGVFVTHERYTDQAALDAHNAGAGTKAFFASAEGHIESVDIHVGDEISP